MAKAALGFIETRGNTGSVVAMDAMLKTANVDLVKRVSIGGKGLVVLTGNIDAVKASLLPTLAYLKEDGSLAGYSLITNPHESVLRELL
jgi:ethanolamine utilization protein EutM